MSGYIITLRKNNPSGYPENNSNENALLGHYDQLEVRKTFTFTDFYFSTPVDNNTAVGVNESYGETQRIYLYRLPENYSVKELKTEKDIKDMELEKEETVRRSYVNRFFKLKHESGKNSSIPYDIRIKRKCRICKKKHFSPQYFIVSLLTLDKSANSYFSLLEPRKYLFSRLESHIESFINEMNENNERCHCIHFEVFSLMGSGDICILWYTSDITYPAKCLQRLKRVVFSNSMIPLLFSTYSVISLLRCEDRYTKICKDKNAYVDIHLSFRSCANQERVLEALLKKCEMKESDATPGIRYGNYDVTVRIPANNVPFSLYSRKETSKGEFRLNSQSVIFSENCHNASTRFIFNESKEENVPIYLWDEGNEEQVKEYQKYYDCYNHGEIGRYIAQKQYENKEQELVHLKKQTYELIDGYLINGEKKKYDIFLRVSHLQESIVQTFYGLTRIITSAHNEKWSDDLCDQYRAVICAIKHIVKQEEAKKEGYRPETCNVIVSLLRVLQQVYDHIEQGNRTYFDASGSGLSYAGSHERAIWAYCGIVKLIIEIIYRIKRKSVQVKLIPILYFSDLSRLESTPYPCEINGDEYRLIVCSLPYAALYNMPKYIQFLAHELHHYCAPSDRYTRNRILGVYTIALMLSHYMLFDIASKLKTESQTLEKWIQTDLGQSISKCCTGIAFPFVNENYKDILNNCGFYVDASNDKERICPDAYWDIYSKCLVSVFYRRNIKEIEHLYEHEPNVNGIFILYSEWCVKNMDKIISDIKGFCSKKTVKIFRRFCLKDKKDNFVFALKKVFDEEDNRDNSDYLNAILANAYGALEACCDYFMQQITKLEFESGSKDKVNKEREEKYYYLNFVSDFLYACGFDIKNLKNNGGEFCIRLGIHLYQLFLKGKQFSTMKEEIDELYNCLNEWYKYNDDILKERISENRDLNRIKFRIVECYDFYKKMYSQFVDKRGYYFIHSDLLYLSDFRYIFKHMFLKQEDIRESEKNFRQRVKRFREFSKKYNEIQNIKFEVQNKNFEKQDKKLKKIRSVLCFNLHTEIIEFFNRQPSLRTLNKTDRETSCDKALMLSEDAKDRFKALSRYDSQKTLPIWKYEVHTREDFFKIYDSISKELINKNGAKFIWFRGQANSEHKLIPTIYREFNKMEKASSSGSILEKISDYQQMYLDQFLARASESHEISSTRIMSVIDWIACMQHYGVLTNLLDWSENLLVALYFMLEPFILSISVTPENEKTQVILKKMEKAIVNGASLYLFNPIAYNEMWVKNGEMWIENEKKLCNLFNDLHLLEHFPLPNLSMTHTANRFGAYVLGDSKIKICAKIEECAGCSFQNPIAIMTNQCNARLKTQAGMFLAFSLYRTSGFDNAAASIESLQDKWLEADGTKPFLYKIILKGKSALEDLADWTQKAGMNTYRAYPELENIGNYIKRIT